MKNLRILIIFTSCYFIFVVNLYSNIENSISDENKNELKYDVCLSECFEDKTQNGYSKKVAYNFCKIQKEKCSEFKQMSKDASIQKKKRGFKIRVSKALTTEKILWNQYATCMKSTCKKYSDTIKTYE